MTRQARHNALEYELLREQAGALGIAGKQLRDALAAYARHLKQGGLAGQPRTEHLLDEVASKAYALLLQREILGFVHDNVAWLSASFELPAEIWPRMGALPAARPNDKPE
ncbi:MAG: DUF6665 family protein [Burkholderiaceae bacterium]